ncbi:MAG TPA: SDR family oxidoreductase [Chthoniobacterales bacterium]
MSSISYFAECTVLITGASAGLGREFARQLAPVVSTMVLVARRHERLETLALELKVINPDLELFSRPVDLGNEADLKRFADWLDESGLAIDLLVNNAGLGDQGPFVDGQWDRIEAMLRVNVYALTYLTYRILPRMQKAGCGAILNVSSVASFLPVPNMGVYAATKAYVTSFSEALRAELRGVNISVTTLCPGPVLTEFSDVAHRTTGSEAKAPEAFLVPVQDVVRDALNGVARDRARVVPGALVNLVMTLVAFVPMFIKRLVYQVQLNEPSRATRESERNYETTVAR